MKPVMLISFLFLFGGTMCAQKSVNLSFQPDWKKGDQFRYQTDNETDVKVVVMGQEQTTVQKQTQVISYEVKKPEKKGNELLQATIESMKVKNVTPQMTISFDSEQPEKAGPFGKIYQPLVNATFSIELGPGGEVENIRGMEEVLDEMMESMPAAAKGMMGENLKGQFGNEAMNQYARSLIPPFPGKPVEVGAEWTQIDTVNAGGMQMIMANTYQLKDIGQELLTLSFEGTILTNPDEVVEMGGMQIRYNLKGAQSGEMTVFRKTGLVNRSQATISMEGPMLMSSPNAGEMEMSMLSKSTVTVEWMEE